MNTLKIDFEKLSLDHWTPTEKANAAVVHDFIQHLMNEHDFDYIRKNYGHHNYIQRNRAIPDGISGLIGYVKAFVKNFPEYSYDVKYIMASGDMVVFHSHITTKAKHRGNESQGFIVTDRWRVVNGEIQDHWDAIQPINGFFRFYIWLIGGKVRNSNSTF